MDIFNHLSLETTRRLPTDASRSPLSERHRRPEKPDQRIADALDLENSETGPARPEQYRVDGNDDFRLCPQRR
jgi:hypothetical protein